MLHFKYFYRFLTWFCLIALPLSSTEHHGQVKFGGLPLPGATVTATLGEKKLVAVTDPDGVYSFADLADGTWTFDIEMLCFAPLKREVGIAPNAPSPAWEMKLLPIEEIKPATPPPAAEAAPPPAATATAASPAAGNSKNAKKAKGAPAAPASLAQSGFQRADVNASAGAAATPKEANDAGAAGQGNVNEANPAPSDGFLINGSVNNGAASPFAQAAAFGNNRRNGRNLYNGNVGFIVDNSALDARNFSLTGQDTPKPAYNRVQGVASFGGPLRIPWLVKRNGPNVTVNYQWTRNRNAITQTSLMPTLAERAGDFSNSVNPLGQAVQLIDPTTGAPLAGNVIPASSMSPQARALLGLYPLPNFNAGAPYNYQIPIVSNSHQDAVQTRVNKAIGRKNQVSGMFAAFSSRADTPNVFGFLDITGATGVNTNLNLLHRFQQRLFTTLGVQFSRMDAHNTPFFANQRNVSGEAGITGNNQEPQNWGPPNLSFAGGIASLTDGQRSVTRNQTIGFSDSTSWSHGAHNFIVGGDYRRLQFNLISQQDPRGSFTFTGAAAGSDFAGFLLGVPDTSSIAFGNADKYFRSSFYDAYFTDDWRISPGLTVNAGARWEYGSPITEVYGRLVNLDVLPGFTAIAPVAANQPVGPLTGRRYPESLLQPYKQGFSPRIGFAWHPILASSLVVRGGYGVYYDTSIYQPIAIQMAQQPPLSKSLNVSNGPGNPLTLANGFYAPPNVTTNTFAIDPDFRTGYSQNWQLSVQRDLPGSMVFTGTYLGIKGTRAAQDFLPNTYPIGGINPCPACPSGYSYKTSNGNSTRHAGQVQMRRRLRNGLTWSLQYVYSKSIDNASLGGKNQPAVIAQDWRNLRGERGLSPFDQRHLLTVQAQYSTGVGLGGGTLMGGWRGSLFKDWTFVSAINAGSGLPLTPVYIAAVGGAGKTGSIRPDFTGADIYAAPQGLFLNPAAVRAPAPGQWGNAGRNSITGPSQFSLNGSMSRTFRLGDRWNADLRFDATNALNTVTYPTWNTNINSAQFGLPVTANPMRIIQTTFRVRF